jgi:hypothetical protein
MEGDKVNKNDVFNDAVKSELQKVENDNASKKKYCCYPCR